MKKLLWFGLNVFLAALAACDGGGGEGNLIQPTPTLTSITVTPPTSTIATGASQQFTATGTYSDNSTKDITSSVSWTSSDGTRATVSATGLATAASNAAGSTTITATSGVSGSAVLKVIANLPKTGQTTSYGTIALDDGALQRGVAWPNPRFTDDGDGTVTDNLTGLMWLKNANCINTSYASFDNDGTAGDGLVTWQHALDFVAGINAGTYPNCGSGHANWRLPNRKELRSLINYGQSTNATWLNNQGLTNVQAGQYWSSGTYVASTASAWDFIMDIGHMSASPKASNYYVWPVRSGLSFAAPAGVPKTGQTTSYDANTAKADDGGLQKGIAWPNQRFTDNDDGTVTDNLTGLIWARDGSTPAFTGSSTCSGGTKGWQNALDYVACLKTNNYIGYNDWRMPNVNELESLIHAEYTKETICGGACWTNAAWLNFQGFINVQANFYWSSSTYAANTASAWGVGMDVGSMYESDKVGAHYVLPVRGGQ